MYGLAVSGGGALGIGPAYYLSLAESDGIDWQSKTHFYAGTSTGSIIASALAFGMTGDEIYNLYSSNIQRVFTRTPWYKKLLNRRLPKYDNTNLKELLDCAFGEARICDLSEHLYITTNLLDRDNADKIFDNLDNFCLKDAVASSCSAPTYFTPYGDKKNMSDGGLFANDPIAVLACGMKQEEAENPKIISFATCCSVPDNLENCGDKSTIEWAMYIIDNVVARTGNYNKHLASMLIGKKNILRLSPMIEKRRKMDDVSDKNIDMVKRIWENYYQDTKDVFRDFIEG